MMSLAGMNARFAGIVRPAARQPAGPGPAAAAALLWSCGTRPSSALARNAPARQGACLMSDSWDVVDLLAEIADVGRDPVRGGYSRHVFEPAELELRAWFTRRAAALGLTVER